MWHLCHHIRKLKCGHSDCCFEISACICCKGVIAHGSTLMDIIQSLLTHFARTLSQYKDFKHVPLPKELAALGTSWALGLLFPLLTFLPRPWLITSCSSLSCFITPSVYLPLATVKSSLIGHWITVTFTLSRHIYSPEGFESKGINSGWTMKKSSAEPWGHQHWELVVVGCKAEVRSLPPACSVGWSPQLWTRTDLPEATTNPLGWAVHPTLGAAGTLSSWRSSLLGTHGLNWYLHQWGWPGTWEKLWDRPGLWGHSVVTLVSSDHVSKVWLRKEQALTGKSHCSVNTNKSAPITCFPSLSVHVI